MQSVTGITFFNNEFTFLNENLSSFNNLVKNTTYVVFAVEPLILIRLKKPNLKCELNSQIL
jgi:competence transcription factor ComK